MGEVVGILNQKGGVGKTTTTANLGYALCQLSKRVLLLDLDPQCNLTTHLGIVVDDGSSLEGATSEEGNQIIAKTTLYDVLKGNASLKESIIKRGEKISIAPSSLFLSAADLEFGGVVGRELLLKKALDKVKNDFDLVLIDCPPALGLLSLNALATADKVIIPVQSEYLALHGVRQLLDTIDQVRNIYNPNLEVGGVLICMHDNRRKLARAVADTIRGYFGDLVFNTVIRNNVSLAEAPAEGKTIFEYSNRSAGAEDYMNLAKELVGD